MSFAGCEGRWTSKPGNSEVLYHSSRDVPHAIPHCYFPFKQSATITQCVYQSHISSNHQHVTCPACQDIRIYTWVPEMPNYLEIRQFLYPDLYSTSIVLSAQFYAIGHIAQMNTVKMVDSMLLLSHLTC